MLAGAIGSGMGNETDVEYSGRTELDEADTGPVDRLVTLHESTASPSDFDGENDEDGLCGGKLLKLVSSFGALIPGPGDGAVASVAGGGGVGDLGVLLIEVGKKESPSPARAEDEEIYGAEGHGWLRDEVRDDSEAGLQHQIWRRTRAEVARISQVGIRWERSGFA